MWRQGLCKDNCAPDKGRMNISGCAQFMHAWRHIHLGQHAQGSPPNLYDLNMKWDEMPKIADGVAPLPRPKVNPLLHDVWCPLGGGAPVVHYRGVPSLVERTIALQIVRSCSLLFSKIFEIGDTIGARDQCSGPLSVGNFNRWCDESSETMVMNARTNCMYLCLFR